jgi:hypothetical protein
MLHDLLREKLKQGILFLPHAALQMSRLERMISPADVRKVIEDGTIIEDYPDDARAPSCLVKGKGTDERTIHVVCAPKDTYLAIITAYIPDATQWSDNYTKRIYK